MSEYLEYFPGPDPLIPNFHKQVKKIVGFSPNGVDPMIRFIWGMDVTERWGEELVYRYPDPDDKFRGLPFFVMEGWQSPDVYDRVEWEANKDVLGDFPERGVWDFIAVLRSDDYKFLPLGSKALQMARESRHWRSKGNKRAVADLLAQRQKVRELKEKRFAAKKQAIMDDFLRNASNAEQNNTKPEFSFSSGLGAEKIGGFRRTQSGLLIPE